MLIQILFERRRCCNSFKISPLFFFFIKLSLLVGYLTGTQIYEIKTKDGRGGGGGGHTRLGVGAPFMYVIP